VITSEVCDVIIPSGSCAHMIRHNYAELFADDPLWLPRAQAWPHALMNSTEYLVGCFLGITDFGARWDGRSPIIPPVTWQRGLGIDRQPRELLAMLKARTSANCPKRKIAAAFGGIFSVEHPELIRRNV